MMANDEPIWFGYTGITSLQCSLTVNIHILMCTFDLRNSSLGIKSAPKYKNCCMNWNTQIRDPWLKFVKLTKASRTTVLFLNSYGASVLSMHSWVVSPRIWFVFNRNLFRAEKSVPCWTSLRWILEVVWIPSGMEKRDIFQFKFDNSEWMPVSIKNSQ